MAPQKHLTSSWLFDSECLLPINRCFLHATACPGCSLAMLMFGLGFPHTNIANRFCGCVARCVFIHDPRLRGSTDAILYQRRKGAKGGGTSMGSPFGRDIFYWPDMPRTDTHGNTVRPATERLTV